MRLRSAVMLLLLLLLLLHRKKKYRPFMVHCTTKKRKEAVYLTLSELLHVIRAFMCVCMPIFFYFSSVCSFYFEICAFFIDFSCRLFFLFRTYVYTFLSFHSTQLHMHTCVRCTSNTHDTHSTRMVCIVL